MRRLLSITLLLLLGLPLLAAVAGSAQAEAQLPMCCRRGAVHHCAAMEMGGASETPVMRMTCPAYPHSAGVVHEGGWTFEVAADERVEMVAASDVAAEAEAGFRVSTGRAWQKRGPPFEPVS